MPKLLTISPQISVRLHRCSRISIRLHICTHMRSDNHPHFPSEQVCVCDWFRRACISIPSCLLSLHLPLLLQHLSSTASAALSSSSFSSASSTSPVSPFSRSMSASLPRQSQFNHRHRQLQHLQCSQRLQAHEVRHRLRKETSLQLASGHLENIQIQNQS